MNKKQEIKGEENQDSSHPKTVNVALLPVTKINKIEDMDTINPDIHTENRFSIFADCLIT